MKIAHVNNFANVAWELAQAQRNLGHEATVFCAQENPFHFPVDRQIHGTRGPLGWNAVMLAHWRVFRDFDIIHVHGGIWRSQLFYPLFKRRFPSKVLAVHFHGSETRTGKGLHHLGLSDLRFHSTPDLGRLLPHSEWIPNPIQLPKLPPEPDNHPAVFIHFPSHRVHKGTDRIIELFVRAFGPAEVESEGPITYHRTREAALAIAMGVPHEEALGIMARSDAVIDQISPLGIYGVVAIEGMALGKPVLGTFRSEWYPDCPVISLSGDYAVDEFRRVAADEAFRRSRGAAGRRYVTGVHESRQIARRVLRAYYEAAKLPPLRSMDAGRYWRRRGRLYVKEFQLRPERTRYEAQQEELMEILSRMSFKSVAEIGCGYGRIGVELIRRFGVDWIGVDLSREQLKNARRVSADLAASVIEGSAADLPLCDRSVDLVLSVEMLMHIPPDQIAAALAELLRASRSVVVHLDWYEDYLAGYQTGWSWVHDYPRLWQGLSMHSEHIRLRSTGIQSVFIIAKNKRLSGEHPPDEPGPTTQSSAL